MPSSRPKRLPSMTHGKPLTEAELHKLLTETYRCTKDGTGKGLPAPYCSVDEMPTYYKSPLGLFFAVPRPPNGSNYSMIDVKNIIEVAELDVVTSFEAAKEKISGKNQS